jgi:hypothetical protein
MDTERGPMEDLFGMTSNNESPNPRLSGHPALSSEENIELFLVQLANDGRTLSKLLVPLAHGHGRSNRLSARYAVMTFSKETLRGSAFK